MLPWYPGRVSSQPSAFKRFLLWDFPRAGWQYDIIVAVILAFIFLTPRDFFRDQPRASNVVRLPAEHGANVFWLESGLLAALPESERPARAAAILRSRFGHREPPVRVLPIYDAEHEIKGFMIYTKP